MLKLNKIEEKANNLLQKSPGLAVSIFTANDVLFEKGLGVTSVEQQGVEVTPETMFRVGSISKTITATVIMKLVEMGKVELDLPIKVYVPELKLSNEKAVEIITLRMLLSHTAGLPDGGDLFGGRSKDGLANYVEKELLNLPFVAPPGVLYSYGNHAINLAGYVAERVMDKTFAKLVEEEIFKPLGMMKSTYDPLRALTFPTALLHEKGEDGEFEVVHSFPENTACHPSFFCISNVSEMRKFGKFYLNGGSDGILSSDSIQELLRPQVNRYTLPQSFGGLCWIKEKDRGINFIWHSGGVGSYRSFIALFPDHNLGIVTLANQDTGWELVEEILQQIGMVEEVEWKEVNQELVKQSYGSYLSAKSGFIKLYEDSNSSYVEINAEKYNLRSIEENHIAVINKQGNAIASIGLLDHKDYIMVNGAGCKRIEGQINRLDLSGLTNLEGVYIQDELQFSFFFENAIAFLNDGDDTLECTYLYSSKFYCPGHGLLEFEDNKLTIQRGWIFYRQSTRK